jgi:hypothetical protein
MLEITAEDISQLNDEELRKLVGGLCEAELRLKGLSTSHVRFGGDQNASDGGLDVVVRLPSEHQIDGFIPRNCTGIQVKKSAMPPAAILKEMKPAPENELRPIIGELAAEGGAYIILSGKDSTTESRLRERHAKMSEALEDCPHADKLHLNFYDRDHVANWVNNHPGMALWVRNRVGRPITGWRDCAMGSWPSQEGARAYVCDDQDALHKDHQGRRLSIVELIDTVRNILAESGNAIRLLGLAGVGKTRLVQALFDKTIGTSPLDPAKAMYADNANQPNPPPIEVALRFGVEKRPAILIVDNCPAELHQRLAEQVQRKGSSVSVLTVEHDIRDGDAETGSYFLLNPAQPFAIAHLVHQSNPKLSDINIRQICDFAGGNARIALMLARHVDSNTPLATLGDDHLLRRMVLQGDDRNDDLFHVAKYCSLVYSFDIADSDENDIQSEAEVLANIAGIHYNHFRAKLASLHQRNILQQRGRWRAMLPPAIANRLATMVLEELPTRYLLAQLTGNAPIRLLKSFAHRMGYLHGSETAQRIAKGWLEPGGLLADPSGLDADHIDMLLYVAPLVPKQAYALVEKAITTGKSALLHREQDLCQLLHFLAREPEYFKKALGLLAILIELDPPAFGNDPIRDVIHALFSIAWSGTKAPLQERMSTAKWLLEASDPKLQEAGHTALCGLLEARYFKVIGGYFGRGTPYYTSGQLQTMEDVASWLTSVLDFALPLAHSNAASSVQVRKAIAEQSQGLWLIEPVAVVLQKFYEAVAEEGFWEDGWHSIRKTLAEDGPPMPPELVLRLESLERMLSPKSLADRALEIAKSRGISNNEWAAMSSEAQQAHATSVQSIAQALLEDFETLRKLMPALHQSSRGTEALGACLAHHACDPISLWNAIISALPSEKVTPHLITSFVETLEDRDPSLAQIVLDGTLTTPLLSEWLPLLYGVTRLTDRTMPRLHAALEISPIKEFWVFGQSRFYDSIPFEALHSFIHAVCERPGGMPVALELVSCRLHNWSRKGPLEQADQWASTIRKILKNYTLVEDRRSRSNANMEMLLNIACAAGEGLEIIHRLSRDLLILVKGYRKDIYGYGEVLQALITAQPLVVLKELFEGDLATLDAASDLIQRFRNVERDVFGSVPSSILKSWCDVAPDVRYPLVASMIHLLHKTKPHELYEWNSNAMMLLNNAPETGAVLQELFHALDAQCLEGDQLSVLHTQRELVRKLGCSRISSLDHFILKIAQLDELIARFPDAPQIGGFE